MKDNKKKKNLPYPHTKQTIFLLLQLISLFDLRDILNLSVIIVFLIYQSYLESK